METKDILQHFVDSDLIQSISGSIMKNKTVRLKGMAGSFDAVFGAAHAAIHKKTNIFILHDKEEANYFLNDLRNFLPEEQLLLFPSSYKKPYQFEETENANILQRAEVLNQIISQPNEPHQVITYPDALYEKVINKRSLQDNTFVATVGEKLDIEFLLKSPFHKLFMFFIYK